MLSVLGREWRHVRRVQRERSGKVQACADFSAQPEHQASEGLPLYVVVTDIDVEPTDGAWDVTGTTLLANEDDEYLAWSCRETFDADSRSMHAEPVNIRPGKEVPLCGTECTAPSQGSIAIELGDSYHARNSVPCIDLAAAVASPLERAGPVRANGERRSGCADPTIPRDARRGVAHGLPVDL
jgi:hypothetical protein